jgi:peptide/nickel transport system substrate-binding protein
LPQKSIRAIGASVILIGVAVAAIVQLGPRGDRSAVALTPEQLVTTSTETATSEREPVEETTTTSTPFTYRVGVLAGVSTDNFWAFYGEQPSVWNSYILGPTKPALFKVDPSSSELTPELALASAEPREESDRWFVELELRADFAWSDGEPVTAGDVAFTYRTVRSLDLDGSWATSFPPSILSVDAISDFELQIEFAGRPSLAVWPHAFGTAPIMAEHVWAEGVAVASATELYEQSGARDVYGGPLSLADVSENLIVSVANPGYPLETSPDTVEYQVFDDEGSLVQALLDAQIDAVLTPKGLSAESRRMAEAGESITVEVNPANGVRYLGFNLERQPMSDKAFREALALLLDRTSLVESIGDGSQVANSFVRESNAVWYDRETASTIQALYSGDLDTRLTRAIDGLVEAGYTWETKPGISEEGSVSAGTGLLIEGVPPAPLTILTAGDSYDPARPEYVEEIASTLGLLGFDVRPVVTDFDTVVDLTFSDPDDGPRQYDMYFLGWTLGSPALPDYYRPLFAPDGPMNNTGYASASFNGALQSYESATTPDQARGHLWAMEQILADDLPYLLLYTTEIVEAYRSDRVEYDIQGNIGGIQARLGGIGDVRQP